MRTKLYIYRTHERDADGFPVEKYYTNTRSPDIEAQEDRKYLDFINLVYKYTPDYPSY